MTYIKKKRLQFLEAIIIKKTPLNNSIQPKNEYTKYIRQLIGIYTQTTYYK